MLEHTIENREGILHPGLALTLRPMRYPLFYKHYKNAKKNQWSVDEISFSTDVADIRDKLTPAQRHIVARLTSFFATGDQIVGNNACLTLYKHVNSPEYRLYLSRQIEEEAQHVDCYLLLLDNYIPDEKERYEAFAAVENIPSIQKKAEFCFKWMEAMDDIDTLETDEHRRTFLLNLITFASAVEGLFFYGAFAYVFYLRSQGLLNGLGAATNWIFRDESMHMNVAFDVIDVVKHEYSHLWDQRMKDDIVAMLTEAVECENQFAHDVLDMGVGGMSPIDMELYLKYCADQRLERLGIDYRFGGKNNFTFMDMQDLHSHENFFERTPTQYQIGVSGKVSFDEDF